MRDVIVGCSVLRDVIGDVTGRWSVVAADHLVPDELEKVRQWKLVTTAAAREEIDARLLAATVICPHTRTHTHVGLPD